jgi:hypothetical protein
MDPSKRPRTLDDHWRGNGTATRSQDDIADVTYARGAHGPVPADGNQPGELTCYVCDAPVVHVAAHPRIRGGTAFNVRAHFRHKGSGSGCNVTGESACHKAAVDAFNHTAFTFERQCVRCKGITPIMIPGSVHTEQPWLYHDRAYRLDVGYLVSGVVVGAVEVWWTHKTLGQKLTDLVESDLAWCEVTASVVHDALRRGNHCLRAATCSEEVCQECQEQAIQSGRDKLYEAHMSAMQELTRRSRRVAVELREACDGYACIEQGVHNQLAQDQLACARAKESIVEAETGVRNAMLNAMIEWATEQLTSETDPDWEALDVANQRAAEPQLVMAFGKHKGTHIDEIWEARDPYIVWIAGWHHGHFDGNNPAPSTFGRTPPRVQRDYARSLLRGHCHVCFEELDADWKNRCRDCYFSTRR